MVDFYLKAPDAGFLDTALLAAGVLVEETTDGGPVLRVADGYALDVVGTLYDRPVQTGTDKDGMPLYAAPVKLDGYHANLRVLGEPSKELMAALEPVRIAAPTQPRVEWAGGMFPFAG